MGVVFDGRAGAVFWALSLTGAVWAFFGRALGYAGRALGYAGRALGYGTLRPISDDPNNDVGGLGGGRARGAINRRFSGGESTFEYDSIRSI